MDAALLFGLRHALDAMNAAFEFQLAVYVFPFDQSDDFLEPPDARSAGGEHVNAPAAALAVTRVHAKDFLRKQTGFVSSRTGSNFQDDVFFIIRIFGKKQDLDLFFQFRLLLFQAFQFFVGQSLEFGIGLFAVEKRFRVADGFLDTLEFSVFLDDPLQPAVCLDRFLIAGAIRQHLG